MSFDHVELDFDPAITTPLRDALAQLWFDVSQAGGAIGFTSETPLDEITHDVDSYLQKVTAGRLDLLVASTNGRMIGCCVFVPNDLAIQEHFVTLKRFMVHPNDQHQGFGRWLVERACAIAGDQLSVEDIHVTVRSGIGNETFWKRCEFRQVAAIPRAVKLPNGDYRDSLYLIRSIAGP